MDTKEPAVTISQPPLALLVVLAYIAPPVSDKLFLSEHLAPPLIIEPWRIA